MSSPQRSNEEVIFNTARKIDSLEARQEYLVQVCAGDAALQERVENLLRSQADESQFLETPAVEFTQKWEVFEKPGEQIGRYKLLQKIGEGGFGVVYMAEQEKPIRRKVALKIIKAGMDTREVIARFEAERQALALMDHPNIAKVLDGGATGNGRPYFVMELVKGVPLTKFCDENKLDTLQRLELFQSVCKAIQHAHQKGIIHRDIKPSNVMVTLHDGQPVVKVIDFGVSKAIAQQLTEKTMFTAYGQMIGTPQYMSPEQAEMSGLDIDTRSDIYSLGVLLYELLTGSTPIQPERLRETGFAEMQRLIREEEPPRPSMRLSTLGEQSAKIAIARSSEPKKLGALLRGELDWIVMKALEKNRDRRYETANGLAKDVQRYLEGEPVSACPPSFAYRFKKFANKHRGVLVTTGSMSVVLVLGTLFSTLFALSADRAKSALQDNLTSLRNEQRRFIEARGEEALENSFDQFLRGNVEQSRKSLNVAQTHNATPGEIVLCKAALNAYEGSYDYLENLDVALTQMPDSMAAKILLANAYWYGPSRQLEKASELSNQIVLMEPSAPIDLLLAAQFFALRDDDRAIKYLDKLRATHNSRLIYYELARVYSSKAPRTYALSDIEKLVQYADVAFQTMPENELACRRYIWAHLAAADYYGLHGKPELEFDHLSKAERVANRFADTNPTLARAHQCKVSVHAYKGEWETATTHAIKANKYLDKPEDYSMAVELLIRQGRDPTPALAACIKYLPGGELYRPLTLVHTQGPEAALQSFYDWESNTERSSFAEQALTVFELMCLLGRPNEAIRAARTHLDQFPSRFAAMGYNPFDIHLSEFVSGRLGEKELFAKINTREDKISYYYATGCLRLGEGKRAEAIRAFEQIEKEGRFIWGAWAFRYIADCRASAYLHRMKTDPAWPPWIPVAESE